MQHIAEEFWCRWRKEYLSSLQSRYKWVHAKRNIEVGDVVIIQSSDVNRNEWPMALVRKVFADEDGFVRSAEVFVGSTKQSLHRPIHKLVVLVENNEVNI